jgi:hypothetical protein
MVEAKVRSRAGWNWSGGFKHEGKRYVAEKDQ